jgi:hypothetical protein
MSFKHFFREGIEKNAPSVLYHVTKVSNVNSILKNGLEPRLVKVPGVRTRTPRIYLFSNINAENIDMIKLFQHKIESLGTFTSPRITTPPEKYEDVAILKVTLPEDIKLYKDPSVNPRATNAYFVVNKTIPPQYLEIIYKGPIQGEEGGMKGFIKKHSIQGKPYKTNAVVDPNQVKKIKNKLTQLQRQAGDTISKIDYITTDSITYYTLQPLERIKFWQKRNEFETDNFFSLQETIYEDINGYMARKGHEEINGNTRHNFYSLGITKEELEQILVNKFNAKIGTSESEMQEIYNELITKLGYKDLIFI